MNDTLDFLADEDLPRARVALLLKHFSRLADGRETWRIVYPLAEVLLLLTCATIASCDDFDDIVAWARIISMYFDGSPLFTTESPVNAGCAPW